MKRLHPSNVERYFSKFYEIDLMGKPQEDQCLLLHSNRLCIVTIAKSHKLFNDQPIAGIDFNPNEKTNRLDNKFTGKKKRGAQRVQAGSILCEVTGKSGMVYKLRSCLNGKLLEVNENLIKRPELLLEKPQSDGYIAIVLPKEFTADKITEKLLDEEKYIQLLKERKTSTLTDASKTIQPSESSEDTLEDKTEELSSNSGGVT